MTDKVIIYQVFTRLFGNRNTTRKECGTIAENGSGKFNDFDSKTLKTIKKLGVSHIWYTGVIRHATQTNYSQYGIPSQSATVVKGKAGSPYAICDYYDVDPDLAVNVEKRMDEFDKLVVRTHKAGLKVMIDFVPNHVAREYKSICKPEGIEDLGANDDKSQGFCPQNNFYYCPGCHFEPSFDKGDYDEYPARATGNDHFDNHPGINDWYETVKLNYGVDYWTRFGHFSPVPDTWDKMVEILLFWASKGIDGFRCDMAEMVPAAFWDYATAKVKTQYPHIVFMGEVYNPSEYRNYINSGFDWMYDKVGMYDAMRAVICGQAPAHILTGAWQSVDDIKEHMVYFLENHDEQRIASDFFAGSAIKGLPGMVASVLMKSSPFMLYAAEEYGEKGMDKEGFSGKDGRTTIFDYWSVDTLCRAEADALNEEERLVLAVHEKTLQIARKEKAVDGDFYDLMYVNPSSENFNNEKQFAFLRKKDNELLIVVVNFDDRDVNIQVRIPSHAFEYLAIPEKKYKAKDLLSGDKQDIVLSNDGLVPMSLASRGSRVWKITIK
ncbi:MAG: alpha-amylase family glycosyl hydrolase [Prevotella sp.]|nr:alpha-amylase family glycosyl hydrolase [Prevotella sp.]MDY2806700.1 alpha-amylase family glycosyl hydrolase [Prevotella sp.]MDY3073477.1 alpha-amylase family glycosyl hydrolase [Prevotella sp.]